MKCGISRLLGCSYVNCHIDFMASQALMKAAGHARMQENVKVHAVQMAFSVSVFSHVLLTPILGMVSSFMCAID